MKKRIVIFILLCSVFTKSLALNFQEINFYKIGAVSSNITTIIEYSMQNENTHILCGLTKENQLVEQKIKVYKDSIISQQERVIYNFNTIVKPKHIAIKNGKIAFLKQQSIYVFDIQKNVFNREVYKKKFENSEVLLLKIIDNKVYVLCKQNKNDYFMYNVTNKKNKTIAFNFSLGTVINNLKKENNCFLFSGYIKDPFLNDQYAYFTKTDLNGKMIWEKQKGKSELKAVGYEITSDENLLYTLQDSIYISSIKSSVGKFSKLIDVKTKQTNAQTYYVFKNDKWLHFYKKPILKPHLNIRIMQLLQNKDSLVYKDVNLEQDSIRSFLYTTKESFKKGDGFQFEVSKIKNYHFQVFSFSSKGNVKTFLPKDVNEKKETFIMPSKKTKFKKTDNEDEYALLLYSKNKNNFLELKKWDKQLTEELLLYFSLKTYKFKHFYLDSASISIKNTNQTIVPILLKIKGTNSIIKQK